LKRRVVAIGGLLVLSGIAVFAWRAVVLDLPISPSGRGDLWQLELRLHLDAAPVAPRGVAGRVRVPLPGTRPGQVVIDERLGTGGLELTIHEEGGARVAVWEGDLGRADVPWARFRIKRAPYSLDVPLGRVPGAMPSAAADGVDAGRSPSTAPAIRTAVATLDLPPASHVGDRARLLYAFVAHEIGEAVDAIDDPLRVLALREGSPLGRERLLVALLRAADVPARLVRGLALGASRPREAVWVEAGIADAWAPMSPSRGFFGTLPLSLVALSEDGSRLVEVTGVGSIEYTWYAIREALSPEEIGALSLPTHPTWARLSFYRLSLPVQSALRILLLLPLGALVIALLRNVVGLPSYGTFMPMLIALALRETGLLPGLALVGGVLVVGVASRVPLQALHLLLVPRLALLLSIVVLTIAAFALLGRQIETPDFYAGIVFPVVILTMLIERVSLRISEEGLSDALMLAASSTAMAVVVYPCFQSRTVQYLLFSFPELLLIVMGALVWLGGYTGYRISDLLRFRDLARDEEAGA
jgi:transglutaminase-like putative cysteine protease